MFDRDGVLIVDVGFLSRPRDIRWVEGAQRALSRLAALDYRRFVVTNQSGVAKGLFPECAILRVHDAMQAALPPAARIDAFAYCPHHPNGSVPRYTRVCDCRKPASGMIERLIADHGIDRAGSFLIGDRTTDIEAAERAGIRGFLFGGGDLDRFVIDILERG